jgi:hypothetical protein
MTGVQFSEVGNEMFSHHPAQTGSGVRLAPCPMGIGGSFPGCEADYSTPSSAEFKNAWNCTYTLACVFMAWCLIKHRDNFTFTSKEMRC